LACTEDCADDLKNYPRVRGNVEYRTPEFADIFPS